MSHFTTIQTQIRDLDALRAACAEMKIGLFKNTEARGYGSNQRLGEYVIRLNGPFDIALNQNQNGGFDLSTDWWEGHVEKEVGQGFGKLLQLYGVYKATREAKGRGLSVSRNPLQDGSIKLTIGGM